MIAQVVDVCVPTLEDFIAELQQDRDFVNPPIVRWSRTAEAAAIGLTRHHAVATAIVDRRVLRLDLFLGFDGSTPGHDRDPDTYWAELSARLEGAAFDMELSIRPGIFVPREVDAS